ncbi:MAG: phosphate signaling complex protein PhoU [Acidobacteria bacterium]|nr:phosphate signaling complex protein PhoU [Acidobacteriota bacterium]MBK8148400.1 phosphate signaling complex protein PhoU [Acidobacteriota bacterium]MBK8813317.1 phosphate signaling complex protein PhoU [Acidobacteriota bacterium]
MEQRRLLERELDILRDRLLLMGGEVELSIQRAVHALVRRDSEVAEQVIERDSVIDRLELEIDRQSIDVLTLRRPVAREMRLVITITKITPILERIADHASSIARAALELNDEPELAIGGEITEMSELALEMLQSALDAFTANDADRARELIAKDEKIDAIYERSVADLLRSMSQDAGKSTRLARLLFVAKNLERIADYVKDICELTVYMKEAVFIKHQ